MGVNPVYNNNYLLTQQIKNQINTSEGKVAGSTDISSFSEILSDACRSGADVSEMFKTAFPDNSVQIKVGNCDVAWKEWDRNDFPVWKYFEKDTSADCLNNWRGIGKNPPQWDSKVQQGLSKIDYGEMVIIIPEKLQKKMESDPQFAEEVLKKIQKWKENYDIADNAIAASYGNDPELNQLSKSYCIQLDENGNVGYHIVCGGGLDDNSSVEKEIKILSDDKVITIKKGKKESIDKSAENNIINVDQSIDFDIIAPYYVDLPMKKK